MPGKIKAVIFDSDGTLLDSFTTIVNSYTFIADRLNRRAPTADEVLAQLAQAYPLPQILTTFFPGEDMKRMMHLHAEYFASPEHISGQFEGLGELLDSLHRQGIKLAIVTGGGAETRQRYEHHELAHYFDSFVHCDRVARSKPDPEGFLLACEECGALPSEAIMVGDSPSDLFAGKNGGASLIIGITHGNGSRESLAAADPDYLVGSLPELGLLLAKLV